LKKIPDGSVDLVYIDPPFNTNKHRGDYDDRFDSTEKYTDFMIPRLDELHRVLKPDGSIYVHSDLNASTEIRVAMDKIFGKKNLVNMITWKRARPKNFNRVRKFPNSSDHIFLYAKGKDYTFNPEYKPLADTTVKLFNKKDEHGYYRLNTVGATKGKKLDLGMGETMPHGGYMYSKEQLLDFHRKGLLVVSPGKIPMKKYYLNERKGVLVNDIWDDITSIRSINDDELFYSTQKPEKLLERVILASSNPDDVVLDAFAGSGTTCAVAKKLGRKSICIDVNPKACKIMEDRLK
jgi:adenine-specific DNA-methyltransferase